MSTVRNDIYTPRKWLCPPLFYTLCSISVENSITTKLELFSKWLVCEDHFSGNDSDLIVLRVMVDMKSRMKETKILRNLKSCFSFSPD